MQEEPTPGDECGRTGPTCSIHPTHTGEQPSWQQPTGSSGQDTCTESRGMAIPEIVTGNMSYLHTELCQRCPVPHPCKAPRTGWTGLEQQTPGVTWSETQVELPLLCDSPAHTTPCALNLTWAPSCCFDILTFSSCTQHTHASFLQCSHPWECHSRNHLMWHRMGSAKHQAWPSQKLSPTNQEQGQIKALNLCEGLFPSRIF